MITAIGYVSGLDQRKVARPEGLEPPTLCFEGRRSIQLSYGRIYHTDSRVFMVCTATVLQYLIVRAKIRSSGALPGCAGIATAHMHGFTH